MTHRKLLFYYLDMLPLHVIKFSFILYTEPFLLAVKYKKGCIHTAKTFVSLYVVLGYPKRGVLNHKTWDFVGFPYGEGGVSPAR